MAGAGSEWGKHSREAEWQEGSAGSLPGQSRKSRGKGGCIHTVHPWPPAWWPWPSTRNRGRQTHEFEPGGRWQGSKKRKGEIAATV